MDFDLIGLTSILWVILIVCFLAKRRPVMASILYVALGIRIFFIFVDHNIASLPDSRGDHVFFFQQAIEWSEGGFYNVFNHYTGPNSYFISWLIAVIYSIFGHSELMAQSISLLLGVGSVYMGWTVAEKVWNRNVANKAGWLIALFPSLILYSCVILREAYIVFFIILALNGSVDWTRNKNLKSFLFTSLSFIAAIFFHGAMIVGLVLFIAIVFWNLAKDTIKRLKYLKITIGSFIAIPLLVILIITAYTSKKIHIPKLGKISDVNQLPALILKRAQSNNLGQAGYENWMVPKSEIELVYKLPFRVIYFLFSPFPWDVKKPEHLIGLLDGFLYIYLIYLLFSNLKIIWANPASRIILLLFLSFICIFGLSIGNFGTGVRHRSKFVVMLILLVAPLLPKLVIFFYIKNS